MGGVGFGLPLSRIGGIMGRPRKVAEGDVEIEVTRDGVFVAEDDSRDKGARVTIPADVANILIGNGHAKSV
jgi:preprotein translocase subunit YajC